MGDPVRVDVDVDDPPYVPEGFDVTGELGRGSSAVVWQARYRLTGEVVALKVWNRPLLDEFERRRFARECHWHRALSGHPNIVAWVWASEPDDGRPWIATAPHGRSLAQLLAEEGPPSDLAVSLGLSLDLLDGLAAMHVRGLIHRDITPSNLLVLDGRGALCDLGIAMPVEEVTREYRAGTPGYVAPELEDDEQAQPPDRRTDVYSAAVTIGRMLGDAAPHPVDHLVHAVAASDRREDRPADAQDFARRLRLAMRDAGMAARPGAARPEVHAEEPADQQRPAPRLRRSVVRAAAAAVLLVAAAVLGATVTWWQTRDEQPAEAAVQAVLRAMPDVAPGGQPQLRAARGAGRCDGQPLAGGFHEYRVNGQVVAWTRIWHDAAGQACAKFAKTPASGLYNRKTYLALSLCDPQGRCDHDWNRYRIDAGPVKVAAIDGCLTWRVSMADAAGTGWLLRDQMHSTGCPW